ncbi:hypothetical protein COB52_03855 [Candidatus Kaiserbacteria bacterium]|nr:MAG: hypothetical protein COB52_03855 [Candidatus Kaiserbacteria bacterium]
MLDALLSSQMAPDLAIALLMVSVFVIYGVVYGTGKLKSLLIALPISGFVFSAFPYTESISSDWAPLGVFLIILFIAMWVLGKTLGSASGNGRLIHIFATAISLTALLIFFAHHVVPINYAFGNSFDIIFASTTNFFWIIAIAIVAVFVL